MTYALGYVLYVSMFVIPALTLWVFAFRFVPFCLKAYRALKNDEGEQSAAMRDEAIQKAGTKAVEKLLSYGLELGIVSERDGRDWIRNIVGKLQAWLDKPESGSAENAARADRQHRKDPRP